MQNHPTIELIRRSDSLPPIPKAFGETLSMLLEPFEFNIDECIEKLSGLPRLEAALIQVLNYSTILKPQIFDSERCSFISGGTKYKNDLHCLSDRSVIA